MTIIRNDDILEIKFASLIADYDRTTLANLYQPIIGYTAMAVYFTLWAEAEKSQKQLTSTHEEIFNKMQITPGNFVDARKVLEATGLLKTYVKNYEQTKAYSYVIFAPRSPNDFFNNTLLYGMLINQIGEESAEELKKMYCVEDNQENFEEISAGFVDVFHPDFNNPSFSKAIKQSRNILSHKGGKIKLDFSYELFMQEIENKSKFNEKNFTKKDMKEISRLATLNGISEIDAASIVIDILSSNTSLDYDFLADCFEKETNYRYLLKHSRKKNSGLVSGENDLASKINIMSTISPKDYLSILQNGSKAASSDLKIINNLSKQFNLTNGVINAILDFVLTVNNNILSKGYCEKIAASMNRENIQTTLDAMNYLRKVCKSKKKNNSSSSKVVVKETVQTINKDKILKEEQSWDELIDELDDLEGDEEYGKA